MPLESLLRTRLTVGLGRTRPHAPTPSFGTEMRAGPALAAYAHVLLVTFPVLGRQTLA